MKGGFYSNLSCNFYCFIESQKKGCEENESNLSRV